MIFNLTNKKRGYVLLLSVVFLAAIGLSIGIFTTTTGLTNSQNSFLNTKYNKALSLAEACIESALQEINQSTPFTGSDNLTFGNDSCSYTVSSQGGQNRTIESTGLSANSMVRIRVTIDSITPNINITSWEELSDF